MRCVLQKLVSADSISLLEAVTSEILREVKEVIDLFPRLLVWHMSPRQPSDAGYIRLGSYLPMVPESGHLPEHSAWCAAVGDMLMAYQEGLGLLLVGYYQKRTGFVSTLYARHEASHTPAQIPGH